ncbi:hypothetical protein BDP27DRAFT_891036 [Rhodocollybia butyracea]|uniref:F-box domain-containing protein n=1 Tax=Rhodocollybia butyracea TaxID=206335 RepID=A0A9P5UFD2_9AGAR|nr:hypothetical protein BDP27DRAFT_891036 [Rhodocollybia butyracea]
MQHHTSNFFDILPNELIADIFFFARDMPFSHHIPLPVVVSYVCRRFRDVALSSPQLWTLINLSSERSFSFAPLFIDRSKPLLLDLNISTDFEKTDVSSLSSEITGRACSIHIRLDYLTEYHDYCKVLASNPVTNLTTLTLESCYSKLDWVCRHPTVHFPVVKDAVSLRSMSLKGTCSQIAPPLCGLTHLEIHEFSPTFPEFCSVFASNPNLSTLCLPKFLPVDWEEYSPIDASSLRSLSIGCSMHWGTGMCKCMLSALQLENLEYLEIYGNLSEHVANHFSRNNGLQKVRTLRLADVRMEDLRECAAALEGVTRVELADVVGFIFFLKTPSAADEVLYFPKLNSLIYDDIDLMNEREVNIICSRGITGLSRVEIPVVLQDFSNEDMEAKLRASGIDMVFIDTNDFPGLLRLTYESEYDDTDSDAEDFWQASDDYDYDEDDDFDDEWDEEEY